MLLLINGPPGVGKSALAARFAHDHPLTLLVDIDALRMQLGQWQHHDAAKAIARDLAVALIAAHLARGYDVVVPQLVMVDEFVERLRGVALDAGTSFVEIVLVAPSEELVRRFVARRAALVEQARRHPETDIADGDVRVALADTMARLLAERPRRGARLVDASGDVEATYGALVAALE